MVNHSPKSCGMLSPGSGAPPGSVALPGLTGRHDNGVSVTVSNGNSYNGTRTVYSPEADSPPTPQPPPAPGSVHHHRPVSLNSVKGGAGKSGGGKRTRWLLCYHMGGGAPSASPSPPSEHGHSQCSTPSPTDHGFKLPNSFSNERPTSLPVALLNCSGSSGGPPDTVVGRGVVGELGCLVAAKHDNCTQLQACLIPHICVLFFMSLSFQVVHHLNMIHHLNMVQYLNNAPFSNMCSNITRRNT